MCCGEANRIWEEMFDIVPVGNLATHKTQILKSATQILKSATQILKSATQTHKTQILKSAQRRERTKENDR